MKVTKQGVGLEELEAVQLGLELLALRLGERHLVEGVEVAAGVGSGRDS